MSREEAIALWRKDCKAIKPFLKIKGDIYKSFADWCDLAAKHGVEVERA